MNTYPSQLEFLRHIADECAYICRATSGKSKDQILNDETLTRAIVRSLEIIGEASRKVNENIRSRYSQVDWKAMAGLRNRLIHDYFGIDYDIVLDAIANDIPELSREIDRIIAMEKKDNSGL